MSAEAMTLFLVNYEKLSLLLTHNESKSHAFFATKKTLKLYVNPSPPLEHAGVNPINKLFAAAKEAMRSLNGVHVQSDVAHR